MEESTRTDLSRNALSNPDVSILIFVAPCGSPSRGRFGREAVGLRQAGGGEAGGAQLREAEAAGPGAKWEGTGEGKPTGMIWALGFGGKGRTKAKKGNWWCQVLVGSGGWFTRQLGREAKPKNNSTWALFFRALSQWFGVWGK